MTHRLLAALALVVLTATLAQAQTTPPPATPDMRIAWDQAAATLADAQALRYTAYVNGTATGTVVVATCTGTASPFVCATPIPAPANALGNHSIVLAAQLSLGGTPVLWSDEARSLPFAFRVVALPAAPLTLRLTQ